MCKNRDQFLSVHCVDQTDHVCIPNLSGPPVCKLCIRSILSCLKKNQLCILSTPIRNAVWFLLLVAFCSNLQMLVKGADGLPPVEQGGWRAPVIGFTEKLGWWHYLAHCHWDLSQL